LISLILKWDNYFFERDKIGTKLQLNV
jgi:hypothetical protein